ncbi:MULTISPECIES: hypothetical protein [unclassified Bacillus cereus group]|uniref:hypothetical protein n=1 Tax=unclassified Bacillus cereus group TaxID=2750818 RepID=UPI001F5977A0|nr:MULTISPECIES: hypothetical protein [unclassified Bacillus cereus group]
MATIFSFFNQGWVGSLIGIIGILIAIVTYRKSKIGQRLVYQSSAIKIIGKNRNTPEEIQIYFRGNEVPRVIKTNLVIWNSGNETIKSSHVTKEDPLRIQIEESESIISYRILKETRHTNKVKLVLDKQNVLLFNFDYLDPNDGVRVEILHTDDINPVVLKGTVIGMKQDIKSWNTERGVKKNTGIFTFIKKSWVTKMAFAMTFLSGALLIFMPLTYWFFPDAYYELNRLFKGKSSDITRVFFFVFGIVYMSIPLYILSLKRKRFPKKLKE